MPIHISRRRLLLVASAAGLGAFVAERLRLRLDVQPAALTTLAIIPRVEWGARPPDHQAANELGFAASALDSQWYVYPGSLVDAYNTVAIHHSASLLASNETMADIQKLHMDTNRWADIGYHYGIDKEGRVYEGRDIRARGASVAGYNTGTIGVVVMGNFEMDAPLPAQLAALQTLVNALAVGYQLSHLAAHREFNPESICPGQNLAAYLDPLAQNAGLARGTAGHVPPTV